MKPFSELFSPLKAFDKIFHATDVQLKDCKTSLFPRKATIVQEKYAKTRKIAEILFLPQLHVFQLKAKNRIVQCTKPFFRSTISMHMKKNAKIQFQINLRFYYANKIPYLIDFSVQFFAHLIQLPFYEN